MRIRRKFSALGIGRARASVWKLRLSLVVAVLVSLPQVCVIAADSGEALRFTNAVMFSPERTNTEARLFRFAPLLVFETAVTNLADWPLPDRFGAVAKSSGGPRVDAQRPAVYARSDAVRIHDRVFERISYLWWRPSLRSNTPPIAQGLRITATPEGQPLMFEILDPSMSARRVVVTQSLEAAAQKAFGGPLPGRTFAVERSSSDDAAAVVLRAIEDGPLELGPVVYLRSSGGEIGTVICRCMPAQVKSITATGYYELLEWNTAIDDLLVDVQQKRLSGPGLEKLLRLPEQLPGGTDVR